MRWEPEPMRLTAKVPPRRSSTVWMLLLTPVEMAQQSGEPCTAGRRGGGAGKGRRVVGGGLGWQRLRERRMAEHAATYDVSAEQAQVRAAGNVLHEALCMQWGGRGCERRALQRWRTGLA